MMLAPIRVRQPSPQTLQSLHVPAPVGGLNSISPASAMPAGDALRMYNLTPSAYGLLVRPGYAEWCIGLSGATNNGVRSVIPFRGSQKSGSADRLFVCTQSGIWNVTVSTNAPPQVAVFPTQSGDAGRGVSCVVSTLGGRFLVYADEENGLYFYSEVSGIWTKVVSSTTERWKSLTAYTVGNHVINGTNVYVVTVAGTSASSGGPTGTGTGIVDGSVTWNYVSAAAANAIGPSLADQQAGFVGDPNNFAFCMVWKSRLWLVEKNTSRAWYLAPNSILGTATSFDFGARMRSGGPLVGLYNWSQDSGDGLDTLLVAVSQAGDVVAYQGTDPSSLGTFGLKGTWATGGVVSGRRIATDTGGDVLILSVLGALPISKLMSGASLQDASTYATEKVSPYFSGLAQQYGSLPGWSVCIHPGVSGLMVSVPKVLDQPTDQLVMAFSAPRGWGPWRDLPLTCADSWDGALYFGTPDGKVCKQTGFVDAVPYGGSTFTAIQWGVLTAYSNLGNAQQKQVRLVRPSVLSDVSSPRVDVQARYNFDLTEPTTVLTAASGAGSPSSWNTAIWDSALWQSGEPIASQPFSGTSGVGRDVALWIRGASTTKTTLVGVDVMFQVGAILG